MGEEHPRLKLPEASFWKDQLTTEGERPEYSPGNSVPGDLHTCFINWIDLPSFPNEALLLFIAECEEKEGK